MEHVIEKPAPAGNLLEWILTQEGVRKAWRGVKGNKGVAGVNGIPIEAYPRYAREHWAEIHHAILEGTYVTSPVQRVEIPKTTGGSRQLGIPTVMDRVIQQAKTPCIHFAVDWTPGLQEYIKRYMHVLPLPRS